MSRPDSYDRALASLVIEVAIAQVNRTNDADHDAAPADVDTLNYMTDELRRLNMRLAAAAGKRSKAPVLPKPTLRKR